MKYLQVFYYTKRYEISLLEMICKGPVTRRGNLVGGGGAHFVFRGNGEGISRHQQSTRGGRAVEKLLPMKDGGEHHRNII